MKFTIQEWKSFQATAKRLYGIMCQEDYEADAGECIAEVFEAGYLKGQKDQMEKDRLETSR